MPPYRTSTEETKTVATPKRGRGRPCDNNDDPARIFPCSIPGCLDRFKKIYDVIRHVRSHSSYEERRFGCPVSGCTFRSNEKGNLKTHNRSVHQRIRHICEGCGKTLSDASGLMKHKERFHKELLKKLKKAPSGSSKGSTGRRLVDSSSAAPVSTATTSVALQDAGPSPIDIPTTSRKRSKRSTGPASQSRRGPSEPTVTSTPPPQLTVSSPYDVMSDNPSRFSNDFFTESNPMVERDGPDTISNPSHIPNVFSESVESRSSFCNVQSAAFGGDKLTETFGSFFDTDHPYDPMSIWSESEPSPGLLTASSSASPSSVDFQDNSSPVIPTFEELIIFENVVPSTESFPNGHNPGWPSSSFEMGHNDTEALADVGLTTSLPTFWPSRCSLSTDHDDQSMAYRVQSHWPIPSSSSNIQSSCRELNMNQADYATPSADDLLPAWMAHGQTIFTED